MLDQLKSFISKKLAGAASLVGLIASADVDPRWQVGAYAVIGAAYLIGQALVDAQKGK